MNYQELVERAESYNRTYSGSGYNDTPDVTGFMGQVSAGSNGIIPIPFPNFKDYRKKSKRVDKRRIKK